MPRVSKCSSFYQTVVVNSLHCVCVHASLCVCDSVCVCVRACVCGLPPVTLSTGNDPMFEERVLAIAIRCGDVLVPAVLVE